LQDPRFDETRIEGGRGTAGDTGARRRVSLVVFRCIVSAVS
jgi:hypothetical protein